MVLVTRTTVAALALLGGIAGLASASAQAEARPGSAAPRCHGLPVTVAEHGGIVHGTPKADVIRLTRKGTVYGGRGNDIICGSGAADRIYSGGGNDIVLAGPGADLVRGGDGRDHVFGEAGDDRLSGGRGPDAIVAGPGRRDVVAGTSADSVSFDDYALSIRIPTQGILDLYDAGQSVAIARQRGPLVPLWSVFPPLQMNYVTWPTDDLRLYTSTTPPQTGALLLQLTEQPIAGGGSWTLQPSGTIVGTPRPGNAVTFANALGQPVIAGLAQDVIVNSVRSPGASATSAQVLPGQSTTLRMPSTFTVFTTQASTSGTLSSIPGDAASDTVSRAGPTATFNYDASSGTFSAG